MNLQQKEVFYRIAQEALHNIVKHARASQASVRLETSGGGTSLEVGDNGAGFDPSQSFAGHMGLVSMRERAAAIGASLDVASEPGQGTATRLQLRQTES